MMLNILQKISYIICIVWDIIAGVSVSNILVIGVIERFLC